MGRSIYCSVCRIEKEKGRDNESCCKKCKSGAGKKRRLEKRLASGLRPLGLGRKPECYDCGSIKENPKSGYCRSCTRKHDNERRLSTGITKKHQTGLCPCGKERAPYSKSYCKECLYIRYKKYREINPRPKEQVHKYNRNSYRKYREEKPARELKFDDINIQRREKYNDPDYTEQKIKHRVRSLTRSFIKAGIIIKGCCEICGTVKNVEAHHDDYAKPMDIRWLCRTHHREHHKT